MTGLTHHRAQKRVDLGRRLVVKLNKEQKPRTKTTVAHATMYLLKRFLVQQIHTAQVSKLNITLSNITNNV